MSQSNLLGSSLPHIDLILLLPPKGLTLQPGASRQRLGDSLLQTRTAVLGVCRGVTLSPSESQATRGHKGVGGATGRWRDMQTGHLIPLPLADYRCPPCWQPHSQRSQARFRRPSATLPVIMHRVGAHSAASAHSKPPSYPSAVTPLGFNVYRASRKGCAYLLETCAQTYHPRGS